MEGRDIQVGNRQVDLAVDLIVFIDYLVIVGNEFDMIDVLQVLHKVESIELFVLSQDLVGLIKY